jgi:hypothetical protein
LRDEIREGDDQEERRLRIEGFDRLIDCISMEEDLESGSERARTMNRSKAERDGSQRSLST